MTDEERIKDLEKRVRFLETITQIMAAQALRMAELIEKIEARNNGKIFNR